MPHSIPDIQLLDVLPQIAWTNLPTGEVNFYNQKWFEYTGLSLEQTRGAGWQLVVHPDDLEYTKNLLAQALATGGTFEVKNRFRRADGEYIWHLSRANPVLDENGKAMLWVGICTDIQDEVSIRREVEDTEFKFRSLIEQSTVATALFTGPEMVIEIANDMMIGFWGKGRSVMGQPILAALPELIGQPFPDLLRHVYETGETFTGIGTPADLVVNGVMGRYYFDFSYVAIRDRAGQIYGVMDIAIDVTERVLAQQQIERHQEQLVSYFEQSPVGIATLSRDNLTFRLANDFYGQLVGRPVSDILDKPLLEALPEIAGQGFDKLLKLVIDTGIPYSANEVSAELMRRGKLETVYVNLSYQPQRDARGDVIGVLVVATDVTVHVLARKQLEENESKLRRVIEYAPAAIAVFAGPDLLIESPNAAFLQLLERGSNIVGRSFREVLSGTVQRDQMFIELVTRVYETGEEFRATDVEVVFTNGPQPEKKYYNITFTPLLNNEGQVYAVLDVSVDVTQQVMMRKKIEEAVAERTRELKESNLNLQRSNAELEQFAYIASHDLQEPIRKISNFAEMLEQSTDAMSDRSRGYLAKINSSTQRMSKLIRDVLAFSQVANVTEPFAHVRLSDVIEQIKIDFELQIAQKNAVITCHHLPEIDAIPVLMVQLFSNIISNSLKYTHQGIAPVIEIAAHQSTAEEIASHSHLSPTRAYYTIEVSDNGIGFDPDHADRIFRIFQRLHGKTEFEGTGIGLSICRKIVQVHHGSISAHSRVEGGACFRIILPDHADQA